MELLDCRDYRLYLRSVLEKRVSGNPRYSLRAFARDLRLSPQMLSFVLNRKKGISPEAAARVSERLELGPAESSYFFDLVTLAHARGAQARKLAEYRIDERLSAGPRFKSVEVEAFKAIADWHHTALLELTYTRGFKSDSKWIAERLGISPFEATQAVERLLSLGLLRIAPAASLRKTDVNLSASYGAPSSALRKLARQLLLKAVDSLEEQTIDERDVTNISMAIDPALLPEAKRMITSFRRKLCAFLEQGDRTEVYVFSPALFRVSRPAQSKRKPPL